MSRALVEPSTRYRNSFLDAAREFAVEGEDVRVGDDFDAYLARLADERAGVVDARYVPMTTLWLVDGDAYLGRIRIRHRLTEWLEKEGGHLGYAVRPSRRREGHGQAMLSLALPHVAALGIDRALVTCDHDNVASRKIIESCGGSLFASDPEHPHVLRFWLPVRPLV